MPTTANKGYAVPTTGTEAGTWGDDLNLNSFATIDLNLGGLVTKPLSNVNVTLTAAEGKNAVIRFTGVLTANITVTNPAVGFYFCENLTTGAFQVQITSGSGPVVLPQGQRVIVLNDASYGARIGAVSDFVAGTLCVFVQTNAPSGWTKSASYNDRALRAVSGVVSIGGATGFSAAFSGTPTGTIGSTTLTIAQIPAHSHLYGSQNNLDALGGGASSITSGFAISTSSVGSSNSHLHSLTMNAITFSPAYADCIIAAKD